MRTQLGEGPQHPSTGQKTKSCAEEKAWKCSLNSICGMNYQYVILFLLDFAPHTVYNED